jgi:hypothetical protein
MFEPYIERPAASEFLIRLNDALKASNLSPLVLHWYNKGIAPLL